MKITSKVLALIAGVALLNCAAASAAAPGANRGTDILHYSIQTKMTADAAVPGATGSLDLKVRNQGHVAMQTLDVRIRGLSPSTGYKLVIPAEPPANPLDPLPSPTLVSEFTTDARGNATLHFRETLHNNQSMNAGKGKSPLPGAINPLTGLKKLQVLDATTGAVQLSADLNVPNRFSYMVKRDISTPTIPASVQVVANQHHTMVRLTAFGLEPSTAYALTVNGGAPEVFTTDSKGRLFARAVMANATDILQVTKLELLDPLNAVVLSATLP